MENNMQDVIFGSTSKTVVIRAKRLKQAIKLFKVQELFPEQYIDRSFIETSQYIGMLQRYDYTFIRIPRTVLSRSGPS